jgi:hypothetical protein
MWARARACVGVCVCARASAWELHPQRIVPDVMWRGHGVSMDADTRCSADQDNLQPR